MKILTYREDLRSLIFIVMIFSLLVASLQLKMASLSLVSYGSLLFGGIFSVFLVCLLNHNHRHHPIFTISSLNTGLNLFISVCMGATSSRLHLIHHFNHHRYYHSEKDWSNYQAHAKGQGLRRILHYVLSASKMISQQRKNLVAPKSLQNQQHLERFALGSFIAGALWLNPSIFIFLILPSWGGGLLLLFISNLFNHDQCDLESEFQHSRNFLNPFENWFFFNSGYHGAHHAKPSLHWSRLPSYHQEHFAPVLRKDLQQGSFFVYALKYLSKGQSLKTSR